MKIRFTNCDLEYRDELRAAVLFYAKELFGKRILKNLDFHIRFVPNMLKKQKLYGEIYPNLKTRHIRKFQIWIAKDSTLRNQLLALAHEMSHARQYAYNEMREIGDEHTRWKGKLLMDTKLAYWDSPWEVDARGWETELYAQWRLQKKRKKHI